MLIDALSTNVNSCAGNAVVTAMVTLWGLKWIRNRGLCWTFSRFFLRRLEKLEKEMKICTYSVGDRFPLRAFLLSLSGAEPSTPLCLACLLRLAEQMPWQRCWHLTLKQHSSSACSGGRDPSCMTKLYVLPGYVDIRISLRRGYFSLWLTGNIPHLSFGGKKMVW